MLKYTVVILRIVDVALKSLFLYQNWSIMFLSECNSFCSFNNCSKFWSMCWSVFFSSRDFETFFSYPFGSTFNPTTLGNHCFNLSMIDVHPSYPHSILPSKVEITFSIGFIAFLTSVSHEASSYCIINSIFILEGFGNGFLTPSSWSKLSNFSIPSLTKP